MNSEIALEDERNHFTRPNRIWRVFNFESGKSVSSLYVALSCLLYLTIAVHTPLSLYPGAPHDDGAFISLGRYLSEGRWLGPFGQFTLMKGPGYPAFLAVANWLGISVSLAHSLLHCGAVVLFTSVCYRYVKSAVLSGLMFTLLLWQPIPLTVFVLRVVREEIYYAQMLLVFGLAMLTLFGVADRPRRTLYAAFTGAALGWFWLTREEGFWIFPSLLVIGIPSAVYHYRNRTLLSLAASLLVVASVYVSVQIGFGAMNLWYYGKYVGVDFKERNFQRALGALQSVRSGEIKPFVPVSHSTREYIYQTSPAFALLKPYFDPPGEGQPTSETPGWKGMTCGMVPEVCGEIAAGWFMWALRDAASRLGYYASPTAASNFFGRLADEITAACSKKEIDCHPQLFAELPPVVWRDVARKLPSRFRRSFDLITITNLPQHFNPSAGNEESLAVARRFLNYPPYTPSSDEHHLDSYTINGWYHHIGNDWPSVYAKLPDGVLISPNVVRRESPDLQKAFKDPLADKQRFTIYLRCIDQCVLSFDEAGGIKIQKALSEIQNGLVGFKDADTDLVIESVEKVANPLATRTPVENLANRFRLVMLELHPRLFLSVLVLGALAFIIASALYLKQALLNVCYVFALACWCLMFARAFLLCLIDATSMPVLQVFYLAPAYFAAASAAVLSCAAWLQLSGRLQEPYPLWRPD